MGRGPACPAANHGRRPFFSCKSPFQIFIHLSGEIPHSAQGTQWVAGKQGAPLYNDTAPVIPPKERNHPIFRLTFHLTFYHREIRSPRQSVAQCFASQSRKLCKKSWMTLFAPGPGLHLTGHAMVGQGRAGSSGPQLAPPRGRSPPVGQSSASRPKPKHKNPVCTA